MARPRLYIDEFVGITNRLETLPLAFAIQKEYGHEIILDWSELDSFSVAGTRRAKLRFWQKPGALRVRNCDAAQFATLGGKKIILRSLDGPSDKLDPIYLDVASRVTTAPHLADAIRRTFARAQGRPVVAVHIRHGDYRIVDESRYDPLACEWPAVPLWWYEAVMERIAFKQKDVSFFLSCTGDPATYETLHRRFDVFTLDVTSPYDYKGPDHDSRVNPVADLFALACCPVMLATPLSGYSHWAANALGIPAVCIIPRAGATPDNPLMGALRLYGKRLPAWRTAGREEGAEPISDDFEGVDLTGTADTSWL